MNNYLKNNIMQVWRYEEIVRSETNYAKVCNRYILFSIYGSSTVRVHMKLIIIIIIVR